MRDSEIRRIIVGTRSHWSFLKTVVLIDHRYFYKTTAQFQYFQSYLLTFLLWR